MDVTNTPLLSRYIDPFTDFGFKRIFGSETNKDLLIDFLNSLLSDRKKIIDLHYSKNEHVGDTVNDGAAIFDLSCTGPDGERFIIEVQRGRRDRFKERMIFYSGLLMSEQAPRGKRAAWNYKLPEVYLIALLEDFLVTSNANYLQDIILSDRYTGEKFYDGLNYIFLEFSNFVKEEGELKNDLDKWLYILKYMSTMTEVPAIFRGTKFEKAFEIAEYSKLDANEKTMYNAALIRKWDEKAILDYAIKEGTEKGFKQGAEVGKIEGKKEGIKEGIEEGIKEGIEKGVEKGKLEEKIAIARGLKQYGMRIGEIAKMVGLSVQEVEQL